MDQYIGYPRANAVDLLQSVVDRLLPFCTAFYDSLHFIQTVISHDFLAAIHILFICYDKNVIYFIQRSKSLQRFEYHGFSADLQILLRNRAADPGPLTGCCNDDCDFLILIHNYPRSCLPPAGFPKIILPAEV